MRTYTSYGCEDCNAEGGDTYDADDSVRQAEALMMWNTRTTVVTKQ